MRAYLIAALALVAALVLAARGIVPSAATPGQPVTLYATCISRAFSSMSAAGCRLCPRFERLI